MMNKILKDFKLFGRAFGNTKHEMWVSLQILIIFAVLLSCLMYVAENGYNPDYSFSDALIWTFVKFVEDPADIVNAPITVFGKIVGTLVGVVGIAIFAVPAGLIGSGFIEAMEDEKKSKKDHENAEAIRRSFYVHCSNLNGIRFWPKELYQFNEILMNLNLSVNDVVGAVNSANDLRICDLSLFVTNTHGVKPEMLAVEMQHTNTPYGFCNSYRYADFPEVKSNITIVCPVACTKAAMNYFAYEMARIGHFNVVVSNVLSSNADKPENRCVINGVHDYQYNDEENYPKLHQFVDDVKRTVISKDSVVIILNAAESPDEEHRQQQVCLWVNVSEEKEDNSLSDCTSVNDKEKFQAFYDDLCKKMSEAHNIEPTAIFRKSKATRMQRYIREKMVDFKPTVIEIGLADDYRVFGSDVKSQSVSIKTLAEVIHSHYEMVDTEWNTENWSVAEAKKFRSSNIPVHKGED